MIVSYILSGLALLAAVANIILLCVWKKRDKARRAATIQYIDNRCDDALTSAEVSIAECYEEIKSDRSKDSEKHKDLFNSINAEMGSMVLKYAEIFEEVAKLKSGVIPDYEAAKEAANAVNDFNAGLAAIMNFDPIEVARARRQGDNREAI